MKAIKRLLHDIRQRCSDYTKDNIYREALGLEDRLRQHINHERQYGSGSREAERNEVVGRLNDLALDVLGKSFNEYVELFDQQKAEPNRPSWVGDGTSVPLNQSPANVHSELLLPQRKGSTPFHYGTPVAADRFWGRFEQINNVKNRIGGRSAQSVSLEGLRRNGKSSFLRYIYERPWEFFDASQQHLVIYLDFQCIQFHSLRGVLEELRRKIERATHGEPWRSEQNDDPFAVNDGLERLRDSGRRLILLIDEPERIRTRPSNFENWCEDWRAKASASLFALVIASKRPLQEMCESCGQTPQICNICSTIVLGALDAKDWRDAVRKEFRQSGVDLSDDSLDFIDQLAGGLPFYTQMIASLLWEYGDWERAKAKFIAQTRSHFDTLWSDLNENERRALRHAVGAPGQAASSDEPVYRTLRRHGLLRLNGRLFSSAFEDFVSARG
jgi:hypothetical protein